MEKVGKMMKKVSVFLMSLVCCIFILSGCSKEKEEESVELNYSLSELVGQNYEDVVKNLKTNGFTNIQTKKIEDLILGWLTKDGEVEAVTIGESSDFSQGDKFPKDVMVQVSYHTFETKDSSNPITTSSESEEPIELDLSVEIEVLDDRAIITGITNPNADVMIGKGIFGDSTQADSEGEFTLIEEITNPETKTITINAKLDGQKESVDINITPTDNFVKQYKEQQAIEEAAEAERDAAEAEKKAAEEAKQKAAEEEANKIITPENTPEFAELLESHDDFEAYQAFADKYADRIIEFDGNIAYLSKHGNYNTRFDFLICYGDYSIDGTGTSGPNFQFKNVNFSEMKVIDDTDSLMEGQNLHIKAKIDYYNEKQDLFFLIPVETKLR